MFDLAITLVICTVLPLAGAATIWSLLTQSEDGLEAASSGMTGAINLALIGFSFMLMLAMMLS